MPAPLPWAAARSRFTGVNTRVLPRVISYQVLFALDVGVKACQVWIEMCEGGTLETKEPPRIAKCSHERCDPCDTPQSTRVITHVSIHSRTRSITDCRIYSHYIKATFSLLSQPITH